ncbi:hypothetical protein [Listeria valentina]|uniref:hypothetical protein n=1 Tax=Listeria valentina TaxID=2705293 RepID=UPI001431D5A6|nr:hypothetical protein [Listeria valentina]
MIELSYYCLKAIKKDEFALTIFRSLMESVQSDDFRKLMDEEVKCRSIFMSSLASHLKEARYSPCDSARRTFRVAVSSC